MTRLQKIITRARDSLADPNAERWSDERLIRLASEAQQDIAKHTRILKGQVEIPIVIGQHTYTLPDDVYELTRVTYNDYKIPFVSYNTLDDVLLKQISADRYETDYRSFFNRIDNLTDKWQIETSGEIEAIVFDRRNLGEIRVFPIPDEGIAGSSYTFTAGGYLSDRIYEANSPYGLWTGADEGIFNTAYGIVTDADSIVYLITDASSCSGLSLVENISFNSVFGITSELIDTIKDVGYYGNELLGITIAIDDFSLNSPYGIVVDLNSPDITSNTFNSVYGIITNIKETKGAVRLWYIKYPTDLIGMASELEIPQAYDVAIKHYVVAHAFDDDLDTRYAEKSAKAIQYYQRELTLVENTSARDATISSQYHNNYKGFM